MYPSQSPLPRPPRSSMRFSTETVNCVFVIRDPHRNIVRRSENSCERPFPYRWSKDSCPAYSPRAVHAYVYSGLGPNDPPSLNNSDRNIVRTFVHLVAGLPRARPRQYRVLIVPHCSRTHYTVSGVETLEPHRPDQRYTVYVSSASTLVRCSKEGRIDERPCLRSAPPIFAAPPTAVQSQSRLAVRA